MKEKPLVYYGFVKALGVRLRLLHAFLCRHNLPERLERRSEAEAEKEDEERASVELNEQQLALDMPVALFLQVAGCSSFVEGLPGAMEEGITVRELPRSIQAGVLQRMRYWKRLNEGINALTVIGLLARVTGDDNFTVSTKLLSSALLPLSHSLADLSDERAVEGYWREVEEVCVKRKGSALFASGHTIPSLAVLQRKSAWSHKLSTAQRERVSGLSVEERERAQSFQSLFETSAELQVSPFLLLSHLRDLSTADESGDSPASVRGGTHAIELKRMPVVWSRKRNALLVRLYVRGRANFAHLKGERLWRWLSLRMRERTGAEHTTEQCMRRVELLLHRLGAADAVEELIGRQLAADEAAEAAMPNAEWEASAVIALPTLSPIVKECGDPCALHRCLLSIALTPCSLYSSEAASAMLGKFPLSAVNTHMETLISAGVFTLQQPSEEEKRRFRLSDTLLTQMPEISHSSSESERERECVSSLASGQTYPFLAKGSDLLGALAHGRAFGEEAFSGSVAAAILSHIPTDGLLLSPVGDSYDTVGFDVTHNVTAQRLQECEGEVCATPDGRESESVWPWSITGGGENGAALVAVMNAVLAVIVRSPGVEKATLGTRLPWLDCCSLAELLRKLRPYVRREYVTLRRRPSLFSPGEEERVEVFFPQCQERLFH